jgi:hypothetical protein
MSKSLNYLIWSNQHRQWWRDDRRGYTDSIEEAGRYGHDEAVQIVLSASADGLLLFDRIDPVNGREYQQAPEVLVLAPEHAEQVSGR